MKVWNATGFNYENGKDLEGFGKVEVVAHGKKYDFKPYEEKEIYNTDHAIHIGTSFGYLGLVALDYDSADKKRFPTYESYKAAKEQAALKAVLEHQEKALSSESNGEKAAKQTTGAEHEVRMFNTSRFEKNIKIINGWLTDIGYKKEAKKETMSNVEIKRPDWRKELKEDGGVHTSAA